MNILLCCKREPKIKPLSKQGFALLESLVGMLVVAIMLAVVTVPIFLATATRVQNRRAEQAMQLAQGEIDRVRVLLEQGKYTVNDLPSVPTTSAATIRDVSAPVNLSGFIKSDNALCPAFYTVGPQIAADTALRVDVDRDCRTDFLVQTFRDGGITVPVGATNLPIAFHMGVRIYSKAADNLANLENPPQQASLQLTTAEGKQRSRPLVVIYTTIARTDANISLCKYKDFLKSLPPGDKSACDS